MENFMDKHLQRLRQARERKPNYREILDLAERMLIEKCRAKGQPSISSFTLDPVKAQPRMQEGLSYLGPERQGLPTAPVEETFSCLLESFRELNPVRHESLQRAMKAKDWALERVLGRLLANQLSEANLETELGAEGSLLFFFLVQSLKPVLENLAEGWRSALKEFSWDKGFCPFCGGNAGMGEIREEGRRFLHCPLCGTEWEYPRMKCPYCQNEDQEQHTYFQVEKESENRVDICLACRHYLKTVDSREMEGPLDFEVEDYLTLHLDHLAQEEGYLRPEKLFSEKR
jgi:FdhE protein